ncbi:MAG: WecB/TagA/CpsF family glycosyltransferase [bacterium]
MNNNETINTERALILGYPVDLVNMEQALNIVENWKNTSSGGQVVTINPEMIMFGEQNLELSDILKSADLIIPDGAGIITSLKKLNIHNIKRLPGIELSEEIIKTGAEKGYKFAFLGAGPKVAEDASICLCQKYSGLNFVYIRDGYFTDNDEQSIIDEIKQAAPDVLFVALGVPKQELFIKKYRNELKSVIMIGVGGSFDVWSGRINRAPLIYRKLGLEWFYRLICQPSRFSRMFPTIPLFFIKVFLDKKNTRKES